MGPVVGQQGGERAADNLGAVNDGDDLSARVSWLGLDNRLDGYEDKDNVHQIRPYRRR